jgi:putative transposase
VALVMTEHGLSERQACKLVGVDRTSYRYEPQAGDDGELRRQMIELAKQKPRYGYRRLGVLLARRGWRANHKRLYRIYREEHLAVRRLKRKRLVRPAQPVSELSSANQEWAMDFVMDSLASGRGFRALTVVDGFTRECVAIEVDSCLSGQRVTRVLARVIEQRGRPAAIRCDNGPEFTSRHFLGWCDEQQIRLVHIQPGRPMQNGRVESFNGRLRDECLNANWFVTLKEAQGKIEAWRQDYNDERPHSALDYLSPSEFAVAAAARGFCIAGRGKGPQSPAPRPAPPSPLIAEGQLR